MRKPSYLLITLGLAALGFIVSIWLLSTHLKFATGQAGLSESCSILSTYQGCATLAVSGYSKPLGIPLPAIAMGYYFALILLLLWAWRNPQSCYESLYVALFLSTLAVPVTIFMAYVARTQLNTFCEGCAMLWAINLAIWPAIVKQLELNWANALSSLRELIKPHKLNLKKDRVARSFITAGASMLVFIVIGLSAQTIQSQTMMVGDSGKAIKDWEQGKTTFLNADIFTGPQVKGATAPDSKVVMDIVKFSDFQCPACKAAAQFFKPFLTKHEKEVRFTYRNYPLDGSCNAYAPNGMHDMGCYSAKVSICAGEQGKFFALHDLIFDNQERLSKDVIDEITKKVGLDNAQLEACLTNPDTETKVQRDIEWGQNAGVEYTPTIIINGRKMDGGALAPAQLEALFEYFKKQKK